MAPDSRKNKLTAEDGRSSAAGRDALRKMKDNVRIKYEALGLFKSEYWPCVGAVFMAALIDGLCSALWARSGADRYSGLLSLIVSGPLLVGLDWFFVQLHRTGRTDLNLLFSKGFGENLGRHIGAYLLTVLFTSLWSLLLVVPGLIKALSYSMTPYVLAERPELSAMEAIRESARLMRGRKGKLFCLLLRFAGWFFLSALTGGLLYVFYVGPWLHAAVAGFYEDLRGADGDY